MRNPSDSDNTELETKIGDVDEKKLFLDALDMHPELRPIFQQLREFTPAHFQEQFDNKGKGNPVFHVQLHAAAKGVIQHDPEWVNPWQELIRRSGERNENEESTLHVAEHVVNMIVAEAFHVKLTENEKAMNKLLKSLYLTIMFYVLVFHANHLVLQVIPK